MAFTKFKLEGKVALISGAAGLLGIEHASALLESGARVVLTDVDDSKLQSAKVQLSKNFDESYIVLKAMDVTNSVNVHSVYKELLSKGIQVDILINNAAINPKVSEDSGLKEDSRLENFSIDQWNLQINVGLTGAMICSKIFGSHMASAMTGGVILNIASDLSVISPDQRLYRKEGIPESQQPVKPITYSVIKTGLIGLTRYLATYWASKNIRCNALSPGGIYTDQPEDFVSKLNSCIPLGRMADVSEYRETIQYLCSDASRYMNGQNIVMDGGRSIL